MEIKPKTEMSGTIVYPGTFDCITKAHLRLMGHGNYLCDNRLIVLVATKVGKDPWFSLQERVQMIRDVVPAHWEDRIVPVNDAQYVPDVAKEIGAQYVLRGLRDFTDFHYETRLMRFYRIVNPKLTPIYIPSFPEGHDDLTSSSAVKELVGPVGWQDMVKLFLPPQIVKRFIARAEERLQTAR